MKHRVNLIPTRYIVLFFLILIMIIIFQNKQVKAYKNRLSRIKVIGFEGDSLYYQNGNSFKKDVLVFDISYLKMCYETYSPFHDGKSFQELINKYVRNRYQDHFGSNRATGKCKRIHEGIDLFVPENTPVYPVGKIGIVTEISNNPHFMRKVACARTPDPTDSVMVEYGKIVRILYPEGYETIYAHLNEVFVKENQFVTADTKVGLTGVTGNLVRSGKPSHLHLEIKNAKKISFDPRKRLNYENPNLDLFLRRLNLSK